MNQPSEGIATLLASLVGLTGILGAGHIYARRLRRGLAFLIPGIILVGTAVVSAALYSNSEEIQMVTLESSEVIVKTTHVTAYPIPFFIAAVLYFIVWLWQTFDARKMCREAHGGLLS